MKGSIASRTFWLFIRLQTTVCSYSCIYHYTEIWSASVKWTDWPISISVCKNNYTFKHVFISCCECLWSGCILTVIICSHTHTTHKLSFCLPRCALVQVYVFTGAHHCSNENDHCSSVFIHIQQRAPATICACDCVCAHSCVCACVC